MVEEQSNAAEENGAVDGGPSQAVSEGGCGAVIAVVPIKLKPDLSIDTKPDDELDHRLEERVGFIDVCPSQVRWQVFRARDGKDEVDNYYEFQIINVEPLVDEDHPPCDHQRGNPFTEHPRTKLRSDDEKWYVKEVFDVLPVAFPARNCPCGRGKHVWKATASVRAISDRWGPGTEIDPHVELHPEEEDEDAPAA